MGCRKKSILNVTVLMFTLSCSVLIVLPSFSPAQPVIFKETVVAYATSRVGDSASKIHFELLPLHRSSTIGYYINPGNWYGFPSADVVKTIKLSANIWYRETPFQVFLYMGTTSRISGLVDGRNVISWGYLGTGILAITYLWTSGSRLIETDCRLNICYLWSLSGEPGKIDLQSVMTHEFGHWCGLKDLYNDADYWLTMYGYSGYGQTHQRTLGLGDIIGLQAVYGSYTEVYYSCDHLFRHGRTTIE